MSSSELKYNAIYYFRPPGTTILHKLKYLYGHSSPEFDVNKGKLEFWQTVQIFEFLEGNNCGSKIVLSTALLNNVFSEGNVEVDAKFINTIKDL